METIDDIINQATDPRETKRALSVKMGKNGFKPKQICQILNVSEQYVSKWKKQYEVEGAIGLWLAYQGKKSYLTETEKIEVTNWIAKHDSLEVGEVRDYIEEKYDILYLSKQSYYDLMNLGGMSYHRSTIANPKRDETQILAKRETLKKKWLRSGQK